MSNTSPLLAATVPTEDMISHVILNTSPHGSDSTSTSGQTSPIIRRVATSPSILVRGAGQPDQSYPYTINDHPNGTLETRILPFYQKPLFSNILASLAIHFLFPFLNGVMLGFGEICANELAFRMGWFGSRSIPLHSRTDIPLGLKEQYGTGLFSKSKSKKGRGDEKKGNGGKQMEYADVVPIP